MAFNIKDFVTGLAVKRKSTTDGANGEVTHQIIDSGTVAINGPVELGATSLAALENVTVTGPMTDAQARAAPLPVSVPATAPYGSGTREYNLAVGTRTAVAAASSAEVAIGALGASREVLINPSVRCFIAFGASGLAAAAVAAGNLPVPADAMLHIRIPAGATHYRVIRDAASDGFVSVIPVV